MDSNFSYLRVSSSAANEAQIDVGEHPITGTWATRSLLLARAHAPPRELLWAILLATDIIIAVDDESPGALEQAATIVLLRRCIEALVADANECPAGSKMDVFLEPARAAAATPSLSPVCAALVVGDNSIIDGLAANECLWSENEPLDLFAPPGELVACCLLLFVAEPKPDGRLPVGADDVGCSIWPAQNERPRCCCCS